MTNKEIIQIYNGIAKLKEVNPKLKVKTSYILAKDYKILQPLFDTIQNEQEKIFLKYGEIKEEGIYVPNEKIENLNQELNELDLIENEINIDKIKVDDFDEEAINFNIISDLMLIFE